MDSSITVACTNERVLLGRYARQGSIALGNAASGNLDMDLPLPRPRIYTLQSSRLA